MPIRNEMESEHKAVHEEEEFLFVFSLGQASLLELQSIIERQSLDVKIEFADRIAAVVQTTNEMARLLIRALGASYKAARIIGRGSLNEALTMLDLPFQPKFYWTVSGYKCPRDLYAQAREELHELIKQKGLGKSKFLEPDILLDLKNSDIGRKMKNREEDVDGIEVAELKAGDVNSRILSAELGSKGIDFIVHGGIAGMQGPIFAETLETFDNAGFENRDFARPFQDPKRTLSTRLARTLVNIALRPTSHVFLDPFCGLGTILQEAMLCGVSIMGVDRDQAYLDKARSNLGWLRSEYHISNKFQMRFFAYEARRLSHAAMPKVDAIATEPILLPVFKENPGPEEAKNAIDRAQSTYERCIREFVSVLSERGDRIVLTSPTLFNSSGKTTTFDLNSVALDCGLKPYVGKNLDSERIRYPLRIESLKKKIVQRNLNVFYLA